MKTLKFMSILCCVALLNACGSNPKTTTEETSDAEGEETPKTEEVKKTTADYDPKRGEGKFTAENLKLTASIDDALATKGGKISGVKCESCHKMTEEKLVGPGWKGVTKRRQPEWIMNFISNPEAMLDKDPELQSQLEICMVRMPNQGLNDTEAREILEFMRKNDK